MRGDAAQRELAALGRREQRQRRGQRAHRGAGVAEKEFGAARRSVPPRPSMRTESPLGLDAAPERAQRIEHDPGVVRIEQVVDQVLPAARPASSSTRFEMLFEPGRRTRAGGMVQRRQVEKAGRRTWQRGASAVQLCRLAAHLPAVAGVGAADQLLERLGLPSRITCSSASSAWRKRIDCFSISSRLATGCRARPPGRWRRCA